MPENPAGARYLSAVEAAARLGVRRSSLYAYASRGRIRAEFDPRNPRVSRYLASDVERLRNQKEARIDPAVAARKTLAWGTPILESGLTLIDRGRFYYRGHDALTLARQARFEEVVRLLWHCEASMPRVSIAPRCLDALARLRRLPAMERLQAILPVAAAGDDAALDTRAANVAATGWRILHLLAAAATLDVTPGAEPLAARLARGFGLHSRGSRRLLDLALILCADHELNGSTFAVRVVASTGSSPYDVVSAGLAALHGPRHGGYTARIERFLDQSRSPDDVDRIVTEWLQRGEPVAGFGHPLYPDGDPRARAIFAAVESAWPRSEAAALARAIAHTGSRMVGDYPTLDYGLVVLRRALGLPRGSALLLFALGRTAGWIAHAMEQYALDQPIRPRAAYTGPRPATG